jgi:hypothetical protein
MKRIWLLICLALFAPIFVHKAHAQTDYVFSSIQCDPVSCQEEGPPETSGSVAVGFVGYCTGDIVPVLSIGAKVYMENCSTFYIPFALVETSKTEYLDDCGDAYYVSYETPSAEIQNLDGITVFNLSATYGCDGSESSPITIGTKPC